VVLNTTNTAPDARKAHGTGSRTASIATCRRLAARRRGQTGRSLSYTIICEDESEMETPQLVPNNVVELRSRARVELQDDAIIVAGAGG
jgi:hypothetical protein